MQTLKRLKEKISTKEHSSNPEAKKNEIKKPEPQEVPSAANFGAHYEQ